MNRHRAAALAAAATCLLAAPALAQNAPGGLNDMIRSMERISAGMTGGIVQAATTLLYTMAAIEFAWSFARGTIQGEGLSALLSRAITRLVIVGIFVVALAYGSDLVRLAIDSAIALASLGGSAAEPSPSAVLSQALGMVGSLLGSISILSPGHSVGLVLIAIAVIIAAAVTAAVMVLVYAELYLMAVAGLVTLGLGGLDATREIAVNYIRMLCGKSLKLLTLLIVNGLVTATIDQAFQAASSGTGDLFSALQILIVQIVGLVLVLQLPASVESLFGGGGSTAAPAIAGGVAGAMTGRAMLTAASGTSGALYGAARGGVAGARSGAGGLAAAGMAATGAGGVAAAAAQAAARAAPVAKGAAVGAAGGAIAGLSGVGGHRQAARDVLNYLNRTGAPGT